ncbi:uncharacterized protein LOC110687160 [Chenopodium quinoa]|uniref:uncharacterized protein LOC110687160 n=1 Tax=Chenopodium quinoa TaxID=63459 RepID=UPI000B79914F|nr:uncharacterized protein LOC110687160 [Chenopodium quinoa]
MQWETRYKFIHYGIARRILYLRENSRLKIIRRDLKAANILLDEDFYPKIADFGMARLFNIDRTQTLASKIVGTLYLTYLCINISGILKSKKRNYSAQKNQDIAAEVKKLLEARFIEPYQYPEWLANVVMVHKANDTWRMCVDFTDLNRIFMHPDDRAKTAFVTSVGVYNYKMMPFGLKNVGATYQRLVDQVFVEQKGRNMEVYVDDSIVKSKERGIDANPAKVQAALDLPEPKTKRDIQRLTGRMAALSRFISKASDKGLPFFKALKFPKSKELIWEDEQKVAFQQLREHLANLPTLARPAEGEFLYLYVAVSPATVSAVLLKEEEKVQQPIYFVSHTLTDAETRYPLLEKVAYAVVVAARKLRPYFDSRQIVVLTDQPLEKVLGKVEKSGRLTKWAFELTEFSISYQPRAAIKAQALADFLAECSYQETLDEGKGTWIVFTDGSATINGSGARVVITSLEGRNFKYALKFSFKASNNEAEYEAAVAGLELCIALEAEHVCLKTDSQLVANQIRGEYEAKEPSMISYLAKIKSVIAKLRTFEIELIPRGQNAQADALSKLASSTLTELNRSVYVEVRRNRSIDQEIEVQCAEAEPSWMDPILAYKLQGTLPEDRNLATKMKRVGSWFIIYKGELLKKSFSAPLLKCVGPTNADYILREIHFGICGNHIGGRTLAHKALRAGYYWPTMIQDAKDLVRKCEKCQKFAPVIHRPSRDLQPILNPLPFAQWGLDILGPFLEAPYRKK